MNTEKIKEIVEELGFTGYDRYDCKATIGSYWAYFFIDNEYSKNGIPNGFEIHKDSTPVFIGMMPDTREELTTILRLTGIL